jgi:hypothetical protein
MNKPNNMTLTTTESVRLCELERIIQKGKDTFVEVGTALAEIRDSRIYRNTFATFEEYCRERWGFDRTYAHRLIESAAVCNVLPIGNKPASESQARPLAKLPAEQQPAAWEKAQDIAKEEGKPLAARHVEKAVAEVKAKEEPKSTVIPAKAERVPRWIPDEAMDIWAVAKTHLDRILPNDISRVKALTEVIEYCNERISQNK